jgi:hypothetical protein
MLNGTILHFLPIDANEVLLDSWNPVEKGNYRKSFKCCILGIDFIPKHEICFCKMFNFFDDSNAKTLKNKYIISCPLSHLILVKIFAIHPTKPHEYMQ